MKLYALWDSRKADFAKQFGELQKRRRVVNRNLASRVQGIIKQVQQEGDAALIRLTAQYDGVRVKNIKQLTFGPKQFAAAYQRLPSSLRQAMVRIKERIDAYHRAQTQYGWRRQDQDGAKSAFIYGQKVVPLRRIGIYAPGGRAVYPSTVLMCAVPARLAGVEDITLVSPGAKPTNALLASAHLVAARRLYAIGGAQAIAALAFGAESIAPVDKIVGPGNAYVTEAKRQVYGVVGIDMIAGPSEVIIIADKSAPPAWVAADLCAQAEHDPDARVALFSPSAEALKQTQAALDALTKTQPRAAIIKQALRKNGIFIQTRSLKEAARLADELAPEHLQLMVADPDPLEKMIKRAGAIFSGNHCPTVLGDYGAGPNHTLPTSPAAAFMSPLGVYDYVKRLSVLGAPGPAPRGWINDAMELAQEEGLTAHVLSARMRLPSDEK